MSEHRNKITKPRRIIADKLRSSLADYPQLQISVQTDAKQMLALKEHYKQQGVKVTMAAIFAKLLAEALKEFPSLNARIDQGEIVTYDEVNMGVAMNSKRGLMVPIVRDAGEKSLPEISREIAGFRDSIENGTITLDSFVGGTVTLSSVANDRADYANSIIVDDQCIIITVMGMRKGIRVVGDEIAIIDAIPICVNWNHAIIDGVIAHEFSKKLVWLMENAMILAK